MLVFSCLHLLQTQLSHGFPGYSDRRCEYGGSLGGNGGNGGVVGVLSSRLGPGGHEHDPLSLQQALQHAVDEQNQVCDESAPFMTDLPLMKSKFENSKFFIYFLI